MPWEVTGPVKERTRFIELYLSGLYTITELAERFGVSRQKLHKWLARHNVDGMKGLADHSRAPLHMPHRTNEEVAAKIVEFRRRFPFMGPRKIITRLTELEPEDRLAGAEHGRRHPSPREPRPGTGASFAARASIARTKRAIRAHATHNPPILRA